LQFRHEQSEHWKKNLSQSAGYQKALFEQDYKSFINAVQPGSEEKLQSFLKIEIDRSMDEVESAINYLKLRKIKRMLLQNQTDMEKANIDQQLTLFKTHVALKEMEMELSKKIGSVVIR
jgi:DNA primase